MKNIHQTSDKELIITLFALSTTTFQSSIISYFADFQSLVAKKEAVPKY
jgi:hypothetical protein